MYYFVTSRTYCRFCFFNSDNTKQILSNTINKTINQLSLQLVAWVILSDHYHILFRLDEAKKLAKLMQLIHGRSSRRIKILNHREGRLISLPSRGMESMG